MALDLVDDKLNQNAQKHLIIWPETENIFL